MAGAVRVRHTPNGVGGRYAIQRCWIERTGPLPHLATHAEYVVGGGVGERAGAASAVRRIKGPYPRPIRASSATRSDWRDTPVLAKMWRRWTRSVAGRQSRAAAADSSE